MYVGRERTARVSTSGRVLSKQGPPGGSAERVGGTENMYITSGGRGGGPLGDAPGFTSPELATTPDVLVGGLGCGWVWFGEGGCPPTWGPHSPKLKLKLLSASPAVGLLKVVPSLALLQRRVCKPSGTHQRLHLPQRRTGPWGSLSAVSKLRDAAWTMRECGKKSSLNDRLS